MNLEDAEDLLKVMKSCKTEKEAQNAGILIDEAEDARRIKAINWNECEIRIKTGKEGIGFSMREKTLPGRGLLGGGYEPLPCCICNQQIQIGDEFRTKKVYIAHEQCIGH